MKGGWWILKDMGWQKEPAERWDAILVADAAALHQATQHPMTFEMRRFVNVENTEGARVADDWWWRPDAHAKWQRWLPRAGTQQDGTQY